MSIIARLTTFFDDIKPPYLNGEFNNVVNVLNAIDSGNISLSKFTVSGNIAMGGNKLTGLGPGTTNGDSLRYEQLFTSGTVTFLGKIAFNPTTAGIIGTTTNDNAATGEVGEYVESVVGSTNFPASGTFGDLTSISLTAGDWDVTLIFLADRGTSAQVQFTIAESGISQTTGNSSTGLVDGSNHLTTNEGATGLSDCTQTVAAYRQSLSATTTIYAKFRATYSGGQPVAFGRLSSRRVR